MCNKKANYKKKLLVILTLQLDNSPFIYLQQSILIVSHTDTSTGQQSIHIPSGNNIVYLQCNIFNKLMHLICFFAFSIPYLLLLGSLSSSLLDLINSSKTNLVVSTNDLTVAVIVLHVKQLKC